MAAALFLTCLGQVFWAATPAAALEEAFHLESRTRRQLAGFQESWIEWLAATQQGDLESAAEIVDGIQVEVQVLGMKGIPDLAEAAAVQAVAFSHGQEFGKAKAALEAAEIFQPGEPAVAFAEMTVARDEGRVGLAAQAWLRGVARTVISPVSRRAAAGNVAHWLLVVLSLSAFSFVGLQMATRGAILVRDLSTFIAHSLPVPAALLLTGALLVWPAFLPAGLLWMALYWSVLLWGYGTRAERVVMALLWVSVGILPILVSEQVRRLELAFSAPMRAVDSMAQGRLYGSLFSDLGVLVDSLPESTAVKHLQADMHLQLRQWEAARDLYRDLLAEESGNAAALANLGAVYFHEGDLDRAIQYLQQAASSGDVAAEVYFNLSRAFSEQYRFAESEAMLRRASALDSPSVGDWISEEPARRVIRVPGGVGRRDEIESQLVDVWRGSDARWTMLWRRMLSAPLALVLAGPAIGMYFLARRSRRRVSRDSEPWFEGPLERGRRVLLPGLVEAERRQPARAWLHLMIALLILTLPLSASFGFALPVGYSTALPVVWVLSAVLMLVYLVSRWVIHRESVRGL